MKSMDKKGRTDKKAAGGAATDEGAPEGEPLTADVVDADSASQDAPDKSGGAGRPADDAVAEPSELERATERLLRLQADFDNYRKRMARERQETVLRANEDLLGALLTPLDHLGKAIEAIQQDRPEDDAFLQGVRMVHDELLGVLGRFGLKPVDALGTPFDPNLHEALGLVPAGDVEVGNVAAEVRRGYLLNGRVLRAAQVLVRAEDPGRPETAEDPSPAPAGPDSGDTQPPDADEPGGDTETR